MGRAITFRGERGQGVWDKIRLHLDWVKGFENLPNAEKRLQTIFEAETVALITTATWGYNAISDDEYGDRAGRFSFLGSINSNIYRLMYSKTPAEWVLQTKHGWKRLSIGRIRGYSAILPLTSNGFNSYFKRQLPASRLTESHVLSENGHAQKTAYLLIAGVVHIPSITNKVGIRFHDPNAISGASRLVIQVFRQIYNLLPTISAVTSADGKTNFTLESGYPIPIILCPISTPSPGRDLALRLGFKPSGFDFDGNEMLTFDFHHILKETDICVEDKLLMKATLLRFLRINGSN